MSNQNGSEKLSSGLMRTLESTGRTRGSSATPVEGAPPKPSLYQQTQKDIISKIESMTNDFRNDSLRRSQAAGSQQNDSSGRRNTMNQPSADQGGFNQSQRVNNRHLTSENDEGVKIAHHIRGSSAFEIAPNRDTTYNTNASFGSGSFGQRQSTSANSSFGTNQVSESDLPIFNF